MRSRPSSQRDRDPPCRPPGRPDFFAAVAKMRVGEISQPMRTRLGFHIIELTDLKAARQMSFEEAQTEIRLLIENEKRQTALQNLAADLSRRAVFVTRHL